MNSEQTNKVKINEGIVWRVIDNEVIVLSPVNVSMHALTGCGSRIWELIEKESEIPVIVKTICKEYDVAPDQAEKEISAFIQDLTELGVIETTEAIIAKEAVV